MLLYIFVLFTFLGPICSIGSSFQNGVAATSLPRWILQLNGRDVSIPNRDQTDERDYRISVSGRSIDQMNVAVAIGNLMPFVELGGRHYYFQTYFKANYFKSFQFCREHGMELLSLESKEENDHIINYLQENLTTVDNLWTSGADLATEGSFVWLSTGRRFIFKNWVPPNPDNKNKVEHCLHIWKLGPKNFVWNDVVCTNDYHFACELRSD